MFKTFKPFLVLALMVSFTAFLSGNTVLASDIHYDLAGFHNFQALKLGNAMLERGKKGDLKDMIKYANYATEQAKQAIAHAFKEGVSPFDKDVHNIEDSTMETERAEHKMTGGVGMYINELTKGIWHFQAATNSAKEGHTEVALAHARSGMVLVQKCLEDIKGMGAKKLEQVPGDYDMTAVGAVKDF
tara:strand:+ start:3885 stop:4445 length:561 start_codon:yes stop_codon:yes gene_type:complete